MRKDVNIFVEGIADARFFKQYIHHLFGEEVADERIVPLEGWNNLKSEASVLRMRSMSANEGINLVFIDADKDFQNRKDEIEKWKQSNGVEFELFLLPNNKDVGALEDMLEKIINPNNQPIMDCWQTYEGKLEKVRIPNKIPPTLTIPAKKTKIYAYLETLLGESRSQKELIRDAKRNYENVQHWNLDAEYLEPLKSFLIAHLN